jgi:RNA polymerase sigma-70 factor (ECF subfamily)
VTDVEFAQRLERHRRELHVHCYRMVGSFTQAEDLVQEVMLKAWRRRDDVRDGDNLRAWLYAIATNTCLDEIKARRRRVPSLGSHRDVPWLEPYPDRLLAEAAPPGEEPHEQAVARETIELMFLAVIQLLPARQRAAIVLRDVLDWPVADVAAVLELSTAAVNSALQRGRATLRSHYPATEREAWSAPESADAEREVLQAYIAAYENGDDDATLALIADDIRVTMPPYPHLFEGAEQILMLAARARDTGVWRLLPTSANRQPAAACYLQDADSGEFRAFKIDVLRVDGSRIREITTFGPELFPAFDLPGVLSSPGRPDPPTLKEQTSWT